jgi:flagellum-specific peptidoglycan hydrolase FlgJ
MDNDVGGIMRPPNMLPQSKMMEALRTAFGPMSAKPKSLQEQLEALSEQRLEFILKVASMVKMAHSWRKQESYEALVNRMYGQLDARTRSLIAAILQDADPVTEPVLVMDDKEATRDAELSVYDSWANTSHLASPPKQPDIPTSLGFMQKLVTVGSSGDPTSFVQQIAPKAKAVAAELGIDPRIVVAQAALETGWGKSVKGNNLFGVKSHGKANGLMVATHEVIDGKRIKIKDSFRQYESFDGSIADYGSFLREKKRYKQMLEANTLEEQITALGKSGYATVPSYADKVKQIATSKHLEGL